MRVLFVGIRIPPETFLQRLIEGLTARGIIVDIASTHKSRDLELSQESAWIWAPSWDVGWLPRFGRLLFLFLRFLLLPMRDKKWIMVSTSQATTFRNRIYRFYRLMPFTGRLGSDVLYFPWLMHAADLSPLLSRYPAVVSCRGRQVNVDPLIPSQAGVRAGLADAFQKATRVHCVSEDILQSAGRLGLDPAKAVVIRPGVDTDYFVPAGPKVERPGESVRVISVGTLSWHKGYEYALSAISLVLKQGIPVEYEIIGEGVERQRILYTIYDLGLEDHVTLLGACSPSQIRDHLQKADIFLHTSLSEGIANSVLEAMSTGLPVVVAGVGGMREVITDGIEGIIVPPRDPGSTSHALARLACDPQIRLRMGLAGRKRVVEELTVHHHVSQFEALFREVSIQAGDSCR